MRKLLMHLVMPIIMEQVQKKGMLLKEIIRPKCIAYAIKDASSMGKQQG